MIVRKSDCILCLSGKMAKRWLTEHSNRLDVFFVVLDCKGCPHDRKTAVLLVLDHSVEFWFKSLARYKQEVSSKLNDFRRFSEVQSIQSYLISLPRHQGAKIFMTSSLSLVASKRALLRDSGNHCQLSGVFFARYKSRSSKKTRIDDSDRQIKFLLVLLLVLNVVNPVLSQFWHIIGCTV